MSTPKAWNEALTKMAEYGGRGRTNDATTEGHHEAAGHPPRQSEAGRRLTGRALPFDYEVDSNHPLIVRCTDCHTEMQTYKEAFLHECP